MADTHPEDLGRELAQGLDTDALRDEAGSDDKHDLLDEALLSFKMRFSDIQHELLDTACQDELRSEYTDPENLTKEGVLSIARDYARDAFHEYANTALDGVTVSYSDLPSADSGQFAFRDTIVDGFWEGPAQDRIEQYTN